MMFAPPVPALSPPGGGWLGEYLRNPGGALRALLTAAADWVALWGPRIAPGVAVAVAAALLGRRLWRRWVHARLAADARQVTVLAPPTVDPAGGEALWSHLAGLLRPAWRRWLGQPHLAAEYVFTEEGAAIRLWVPGVIPPGLVERAVEAAWPGARTRVGPAEAPLPNPQRWRVVVGGELRLARPEALPLRTAFAADPLRALFAAPAGSGGERACVQILARPVTGRRVARARRAARRLHTGAPHLAAHLLDLLTPGMRPGRARRAARPAVPADPQAALEAQHHNRAVVAKQRGGGLWETVVRYGVTTVAAGADRAARRTAREVARGRAHTLAATFATHTADNYYRRRRLRRPSTVLAGRPLGRGDLVSAPELAALAHLPTDPVIPGLLRAGARAVAPPPGIATPGPVAKPLGVTDTGAGRPVALRVPDARHHVHVLGATGAGKSTLLAMMILADAGAGRGVVVVDPKGDLVTDVLARLPRSAATRVVLIDADSRARPPCLNPLDGGDPAVTVDNLVGIFARMWASSWGPRTEDVMRAACLTLRVGAGIATLADLPTLLTSPAFRARATAPISDPILRGFWHWFEDLSDAARGQIIAPLANKLRAVLLRPFARAVLAGGASTVDMTEVLDHGGICLVRIPKGSLGEDATRLAPGRPPPPAPAFPNTTAPTPPW